MPASDALVGDPPRTEHVNVFAIARTPVTNAEYARFVNAESHAAPPEGGAADPVSGVRWADAVAYCRWLTRSTGHIYRLADAREWEKAARAGVIAGPNGALEWTNSYDAGRIAKRLGDPASRLREEGTTPVGFRVVRGMTGR